MNPENGGFAKIVHIKINSIMKTEKNPYVCPQTEEVEVSLEQILCGSTRELYYYNPGSAGEDIDSDEIINGGSF